MRQKKIIFQVFIVFLIASFLVFVVSKTTPFQFFQTFLEKGLVPLQRIMFSLGQLPYETPSEEVKRLREETLDLQSELTKKELIEKDNQAFRDQFETKDIDTQKLLPAMVIGTNARVPGTEPTQITIDKGENAGVRKGMSVIYKNFLLGIISRTSSELSVISLITNDKTSLTARTVQTEALGIIKGKKEGLLLEQVVLAEKLEIHDTVLSRGDVKDDGMGYRPDLLIGKITAVQRKPSSLFQTAQVKPFIKFSTLRMVYVMVGK